MALLSPGAASASIHYFETESTTFDFPLSPNSQTVFVPKFDTVFGTRVLLGVAIQLNATVGAEVTAENDSTLPGDMGVDLVGIIKASTTGPLSATAIIMNPTSTHSVGPTDGVPGTGLDFIDFGHLTGSGSAAGSTTSNLVNFEGPGMLPVVVFGSGGFGVNGVTDSTITLSNFRAGGNVRITYEFIVPEPSSIVTWSVLVATFCVARKVRVRRLRA